MSVKLATNRIRTHVGWFDAWRASRKKIFTLQVTDDGKRFLSKDMKQNLSESYYTFGVSMNIVFEHFFAEICVQSDTSILRS